MLTARETRRTLTLLALLVLMFLVPAEAQAHVKEPAPVIFSISPDINLLTGISSNGPRTYGAVGPFIGGTFTAHLFNRYSIGLSVSSGSLWYGGYPQRLSGAGYIPISFISITPGISWNVGAIIATWRLNLATVTTSSEQLGFGLIGPDLTLSTPITENISIGGTTGLLISRGGYVPSIAIFGVSLKYTLMH